MKFTVVIRQVKNFIRWMDISPIAFVSLVGLFISFHLVRINMSHITPSGIFSILAYLSGILFVQYSILWVLLNKLKQETLTYFLATLFFIANLLSITLLNSGDFLQLSFWMQGIIVSAIGFVLFFILSKSERWVFSVASLLLITLIIVDGQKIDLRRFTMPEKDLPANFIYQDFKIKPNIYLLSFDSLIPENIAINILKLQDEKVAYIKTLKKLNADIIPNSFADYASTLQSLGSMLALDLEWWKKNYHKIRLISGNQWSPAYEIFKRNGYDIQLIHSSNYFARYNFIQKGKSRINYFDNKKRSFCAHLVKYSLWEYCALFNTGQYKNVEQLYEERIQAASKSKIPTLTITYIYVPGHTHKYHSPTQKNLIKYKARFLTQSKRAAKYIKKYINIIRKNDKNGIIIIFGDHGMFATVKLNFRYGHFISRGVNYWPRIPSDSPYSKVEIIQDYYAVMMAVLDPYACPLREEKVTTLNDIMINLITCLTGGKPVLKNRKSNEKNFIEYIYDPL